MKSGIISIGFFAPDDRDSHDEDAVTMAVAATNDCLEQCEHNVAKIGACYVGSETHPYAVKPSSAMVSSFCGLPDECFSADLEFACKAGTSAIQIVSGFVESARIESGIAIGSDTAKAENDDPLSKSVGSGAVSVLIGSEGYFCEIVDYVSYAHDTADFWRPQSCAYPKHAGRFTGDGGYYKFVKAAFETLQNKSAFSVDDIDHLVLHMPNAKFPKRMAAELGFKSEQLEGSFVFDKFGNCFSACSLLGLRAVFEKAKPDQNILLISYGSGAGSDAILMRTNEQITDFQSNLTKRIW